jgi:hypothetical protein
MSPEDFNRLLDRIFAQWNRGRAPVPPLAFACLPAPVIERLGASSGDPSKLFFAELKRLDANPEAEGTFRQDLLRLLTDYDGFEWPVDNLGRCIALAIFWLQIRQALKKIAPEVANLEDTDPADWWKTD